MDGSEYVLKNGFKIYRKIIFIFIFIFFQILIKNLKLQLFTSKWEKKYSSPSVMYSYLGCNMFDCDNVKMKASNLKDHNSGPLFHL